jgi:hypothetical protein
MDEIDIIIDFTKWERGRDYPDFFDDVALSTISKGYLIPGKHLKKPIEE